MKVAHHHGAVSRQYPRLCFYFPISDFDFPLADFHYFFFFGGAEIFDFFCFGVGELVQFVEGAFLFVLADLFFLFEFVDGFFEVAADVADGGAVIFEGFVNVLDEFLAALFGRSEEWGCERLCRRWWD